MVSIKVVRANVLQVIHQHTDIVPVIAQGVINKCVQHGLAMTATNKAVQPVYRQPVRVVMIHPFSQRQIAAMPPVGKWSLAARVVIKTAVSVYATPTLRVSGITQTKVMQRSMAYVAIINIPNARVHVKPPQFRKTVNAPKSASAVKMLKSA